METTTQDRRESKLCVAPFSQSRAKNHGFIEKIPHIGVHCSGGYARPFPIYIMYPSTALKKRDSEQKNPENILLEINNLTSHY
jgi:hypothetical protein